MTAMQTHLRTMTTNERMEFKRQITTNPTQIFTAALRNVKTTINPLSRETSPHTDQTLTGPPPSKKTGPHPSKSRKKLAQALKKRANYEIERRTQNPSMKILAKALKSSTQAPPPNSSTKELANTLK